MTHKTVHYRQAGISRGRRCVRHFSWQPGLPGLRPPFTCRDSVYLKLVKILVLWILFLYIYIVLNKEILFVLWLWCESVKRVGNPHSLLCRLFNLAYGLKQNYLVKMKFYLFINSVENRKRIKTFLIPFQI